MKILWEMSAIIVLAFTTRTNWTWILILWEIIAIIAHRFPIPINTIGTVMTLVMIATIVFGLPTRTKLTQTRMKSVTSANTVARTFVEMSIMIPKTCAISVT